MNCNCWIVPCNINQFDVDGAFKNLEEVEWKQGINVKVADIVYIYVSSPLSCIKYKCQVVCADISPEEKKIDDKDYIIDSKNYVDASKFMRLKLLEAYDNGLISLDVLSNAGLKGSIQAQQAINKKIVAGIILTSNEDLTTTIEKQGCAYLASNEFDNIDRQEKQLKHFLTIFNYEFLQKMTVDDYVEGNNKNNFCYLVERGLGGLGSIRGSYASKMFGIYYNKNESKYVFSKKKWGHSVEEAFNNIRKEIINIYDAARNDDIKALKENKLPDMFKGKIYYLYFSDKTLPIYSNKHLNFFVKALDISFDSSGLWLDSFECRKILMKYKKESKVFSLFTNLEFMSFLYNPTYGLREVYKTNQVIKIKKEDIEFNNLDGL